MNRRSRKASNALPPPTPSEAAFERLLREFDSLHAARHAEASRHAEESCHAEVSKHPEESKGKELASTSSVPLRQAQGDEHAAQDDEHAAQGDNPEDFLDRMFRRSAEYLRRDPFSGVGERDSF